MRPERDQIWRRRKDGKLVRIDEVKKARDGYVLDIIWRDANGGPRRACDPMFFYARYAYAADQNPGGRP